MIRWFNKNKKESKPLEESKNIKLGIPEIADGFYKKSYDLKGKVINFKAKLHELDSSQVEMGQYLPYVNSFPQKSTTPLKYFGEDIDDYFSFLNQYDELDFYTYTNVIKRKCRKHIDSYNRLIDSDLSSYIESFLVVVNNIRVNDGLKELNYDEGRELRTHLVDSLLPEFPNDIYIYISMIPFMPPQLTKYSETKRNKGFILQ
jgi:hypothetical protein